MAMYLGETIRITAVAKDPDTLDPLEPMPSRAFVDLWAPGVDRRVQSPTIATIEMLRDETAQRFYVDINTTSQAWRQGVWTYRVTAADTYRTIEYGQFKMEV